MLAHDQRARMRQFAGFGSSGPKNRLRLRYLSANNVFRIMPPSMGQAATRVMAFDAFTPGISRYGEHDLGSIEHAEERFFWKIVPMSMRT
jgi:hypothetical protein